MGKKEFKEKEDQGSRSEKRTRKYQNNYFQGIRLVYKNLKQPINVVLVREQHCVRSRFTMTHLCWGDSASS